MKIVYISNLLNHYQLALCKEIVALSDVDFSFIATVSLPEERRLLGVPDNNKAVPWCVCAFESKEKEKEAFDLVKNADVCIVGMTPKKFRYIYKKRIKSNKLTFLAQERAFKSEPRKISVLARRFIYFFRYRIHRNIYVLCASAFTSYDYSRLRVFENKCYKWGYFPDLYSNSFIKKNKERFQIVWAGRFLDWKHPEAIIYLANYLKTKKCDFLIKMIGTGELLENIKKEIDYKKLDDVVEVCGSMPPTEVRKIMEDSDIFAFTSDRGEGWGVVLNEAMNSCCTPVVGSEIGSVPYLIKNFENGLIFENQNWADLCNKVEYLLNNRNVLEQLKDKAFDTVSEEWNPKVAAKRLYELSKCLLNGKETPFVQGICSKAEILSDGWFDE